MPSGIEHVFVYNPIEEMYRPRLSMRDISKLLGVSKSYVAKYIKDVGLSRSKKDAVVTKIDENTTHWRTMRARARKIYQHYYGITLTSGLHVHHEDGDYTNNNISNLVLKSASLHASEHHREEYYGIPVHKRPHRKAYMKQYLREYYQRHKNANTEK